MKFSVPRNLEGSQREIAECRVLCECVDAFAKEMKAKLCMKAIHGYRGWDDEANTEGLRHMIQRRVDGPKPTTKDIDIANYAMFLWNLNQE